MCVCKARVEEWAALLFRAGGRESFTLEYAYSRAPVNVEEQEKDLNRQNEKN